MSTITGIVSAVVAASTVCSVGVMLLQSHGMSALPLLALAVAGAVVAMLMWRRFFSGVMVGVACIVGGTVGAIVGANLLQLNVRMSPLAVFSGAVCGAATWIISATISVLNRPRLSNTREASQLHDGDAKRKDTRAYLLVSLASLVGGPILGVGLYMAYSAAVGVHPMDRLPYLSYHAIVGTVGGVLVGLPYLLVWLMRIREGK